MRQQECRRAALFVALTAKGYMSVPMRQVFQLFWTVARRAGPSQIGVIAAGIAFYSLLSVFPAIAAVIALAGLFIEPEAVVAQLETLTKFVPADAANILIGEATDVAGASEDGLSLTFALGVGFSIYLSTRATTALIHGLNVAYDRTENRSFLRLWGTVIALTASLIFGTSLMFVLLVVMPTALAFIPEDIIQISTAEIVSAARWIVLGGILFFGLSLIYRFGPADDGRGDRPWRWMTPGSLLAALLWLAGSFGFSFYVANFADYNASFGSLGGVIVLLTWLWLSAFVVLLGALLDAEFHRPVGASDDPPL